MTKEAEIGIMYLQIKKANDCQQISESNEAKKGLYIFQRKYGLANILISGS